MSKVYALLVGINNYHPQSQVSSLDACVNDVEHFSEYLKNRFGTDLEREVFLNERASREEFIHTFDRNLISNREIKEGNTILFYYSGRGSYCTTNTAFKKV